ncbi:37S ribosomal protein S16, mitochondrial [Podospora pseudopauciseta]|nr:37S ribosomal protein S16, mitochondrial [Podospora pseudopauciseta]
MVKFKVWGDLLLCVVEDRVEREQWEGEENPGGGTERSKTGKPPRRAHVTAGGWGNACAHAPPQHLHPFGARTPRLPSQNFWSFLRFHSLERESASRQRGHRQNLTTTAATTDSVLRAPDRTRPAQPRNMVVKIRLARFGRTNSPFYNIVVAHARTARNSRPLEVIGTYDPIPKKDTYDESGRLHKDIKLDISRAQYWIGVGAQPTETATRLLSMVGIVDPKYQKTPPRKSTPKKEKAAPAEA